MFIQLFAINIHISIDHLHSLTGQSNDTFDIIGILCMLVREYNNIISFRIAEAVTELIHDQVISV